MEQVFSFETQVKVFGYTFNCFLKYRDDNVEDFFWVPALSHPFFAYSPYLIPYGTSLKFKYKWVIKIEFDIFKKTWDGFEASLGMYCLVPSHSNYI